MRKGLKEHRRMQRIYLGLSMSVIFLLVYIMTSLMIINQTPVTQQPTIITTSERDYSNMSPEEAKLAKILDDRKDELNEKFYNLAINTQDAKHCSMILDNTNLRNDCISKTPDLPEEQIVTEKLSTDEKLLRLATNTGDSTHCAAISDSDLRAECYEALN